MKTLKCSHNRAMLMPAHKIPAVLVKDDPKNIVTDELLRKYGTRMTLEEACSEIGVKPDSVAKRIGQVRYRHYALTRQLESARVFSGKNTFFWTESIARIISEGNSDEISIFN
ncbi:hypothetical protein [Citrobacter cronae]|uniref:Uncharacterized protein n=1 Tax=Citrobacter cronae TaxID=1748967 RepID=A0A7X1EIU8_9ENTR|nr:hypothetical protein [Citrobacter cronae]EBD5843852.1 hypothetical protein [Salmonella enterica]EDD5452725.1 hypothetical protein [Salmonella enterica subsp. enterica serovar Paratyphi B]EBD6593488.1 hypothetical protein [Salmonella enterica]EDE4810659.1 hypothetical protein [Salmonella enterica subsp. enterica serovar Paratyphi B]MBC2622097.1 hypothetical protein [Citrobacter cronae]